VKFVDGFLRQKVRTSAYEELPLVRKMSALDKPHYPVTADVFYGRPPSKFLKFNENLFSVFLITIPAVKSSSFGNTRIEFAS